MDVTAAASIEIGKPIETVFDYAVTSENIPRIFVGYGPIPAVVSATVRGDGILREGATRTIENSDGSVIDEAITALVRPTRQAYRLPGGFKKPFSFIVRSAEGNWVFSQTSTGTRVDWSFRFELTSPIARPFGWLLMRLFFQKAMERCLARLKDQVS
ncbi:MAG: SRPBCC family protein [Deltaproteobacteria bacterium]|nr:SRPBCC family protein [Deltaproteobacteria bacterium]